MESNTNAPKYDPHITPAETAARQEREGDRFMEKPVKEGDINTTKGYTVDKEGLLNNFAIEPEMYINEPGDLRGKEQERAAERADEVSNLAEDKDGKLTMESDRRGKGQGLI